MRRHLSIEAGAIPLLLAGLLGGGSFAQAPTVNVPVIVTAAPVYLSLAALHGGERFPQGAQLLLFKNGQAVPLVAGFAASADASVAFDAKSVLFAGKRAAGDKWAVWELNLGAGSVRLVIKRATDVIRPLYLPGEKLVYARQAERGFAMETANLDGENSAPLSFMQAGAIPDDVLADGRILFEAGFPLGTALDDGGTAEMFLVYSDGSGVESYRCDHGLARWGGRQLGSGDVIFTHGRGLARFTSPQANEVVVPALKGEFPGAVAEMESGAWLVTTRKSTNTHFEVKMWKPGAAAMQRLLSRRDADLVEPVLLAPRNRPKRHPSGLHDWEYANLLALDARQSREGAVKGTPSAVRMEMMNEKGNAIVLGTAPVEADGSFFVKAPGDKPVRLSLLDEHGTVLRREQGWFWIRRGEQRICVGCHAGPEHASENRVPAVLLRSTTPVDLTGGARGTGSMQATAGGR